MFENLFTLSDSIFLASILILTLCAFIIISFILYYYKRKDHFKQQHLLKVQFEQALHQSQLEIQEQTFKTISQELHDNIGQILSLTKLHLNTLNLNLKEKAEEKINDAKELLTKAIQDIRDLSKTLNTDTIVNVGITGAIAMELNVLKKTGAIETCFEVNGTALKIDPRVELILFRIVQEAFHNIIKHAKASTIAVEAAYSEDALQLIIQDDGEGFAISTKNTAGEGLHNMENRCRLIKGTFNIHSALGKGTRISIDVPIPREY